MHVGIDVLWKVEVDDVGDELEINATGHARLLVLLVSVCVGNKRKMLIITVVDNRYINTCSKLETVREQQDPTCTLLLQIIINKIFQMGC